MMHSKSFILTTLLRMWIWTCQTTKIGTDPFNRQFISALLGLSLACMGIPIALAQVPDRLSTEAGQVLLKQFNRDGVIIGEYYQYLPSGWITIGEHHHYLTGCTDYRIQYPIGSKPLVIVVLVHGSIDSDDEARTAAQNYLNRYVASADSLCFAIIAPVFSQTDFEEGPLGGYRGMVGRHRSGIEPRITDADGFVNGILDAYLHKHPEIFSRKALFYGHSAGGQFMSRYLVTHPDRVAAMVISSAGTYAFPDASIEWTDGLNSTRRTLSWGPAPDRTDYVMRPSGGLFRRAARLPVTVVVGDSEACSIVPDASFTPGYDDGTNGVGPCCAAGVTSPCRQAPQWSSTGAGTNHMRGRLWVQSMRDFAGLSPTDPGVVFQSLPNVQHSSAQTQPVALPILMTYKPTHFTIDWLGSAMAPVLSH